MYDKRNLQICWNKQSVNLQKMPNFYVKDIVCACGEFPPPPTSIHMADYIN